MAFQFNQEDRPLEGYTIQRGVGRGGFGEVYYALSDGGKEVALKFLRENPAIELRGVSHCLNLKSPYLVGIHDIRQNDHADWFVIMEYVNGPSLRDLMTAEPAGLGPQKAAYFLREIAKGLAYLHDRGIVHRDLKPGNIFYEDGYVKIGDYGLAKLMSASQHSGQTVSVGTVHYMAPEVGSGNYDRTIDIYALGVILYEMLLGRVPYSGATMGEVLMKHLTAQPEVDELPEPFPRVIRKALAKDPKDRYQTVQEMISELFSVASLDESVAAFEPASLSTLAARAAKELNVRQADASPAAARYAAGAATLTGVGGSSNTGGLGANQPFVRVQAGGPPGAIGRFHNRIGRGMGRLADRIDGTRLGRQFNDVTHAQGAHGARVVIAALLAIGVSLGVSVITGDGRNRAAVAGVVFLNIAGIVQGVLIGSWLCFHHLKIESVFVPRLIIAGIASVGLVGASGLAAAMPEQVGPRADDWVRALILCMIFGDWAGRFFAGRKGDVSLGSALSIGAFGFVAGLILARGEGFKTAVIAAAASIVIQAIGSLWPMPRNAVVPKTAFDDEDEEDESSNGGASETPAPVVVEPPGFARSDRAAVSTGQGGPPPIPAATGKPSTSTLAPDRHETDPRLRRSSAVRALWLMFSTLALVGGIILYATPHLIEEPLVFTHDEFAVDREVGFFSIFGTACMALFIFLFTRSWAGYKRGAWRGIFRPAIFFGGVAVAACSGITMGMMHIDKEFMPLALAGILLGAVSSLFVWFVPVAPYKPAFLDDATDEEQRRAIKSRRLKRLAYGVFGLGCAIIAMVGASVSNRDAEEAIPPIAVVTTILSMILWGSGYAAGRPRKAKPEPARKLSLPLRHVFEVDANSNLSRLIERHMTVFGYQLTSKSDLLWCFERGAWSAQFWQSDIRQWKIKCNIAAFELDTGGYRVTCYVDVDAGFVDPDQKQLAALHAELLDLQGLLGGREAPSGSSVTVTKLTA